MDGRQLATMLIIGAIAGWLASFVVGGGRWGVIGYVVAGVIGGVVGGWLLDFAKISLDLGHPIVNAIAKSAIGAIVVIIVARIIA